MACVCENNDRKASERGNRTLPGEIVDLSTICQSISLDEMEENQYYEVADCTEGDYRRVLEGI